MNEEKCPQLLTLKPSLKPQITWPWLNLWTKTETETKILLHSSNSNTKQRFLMGMRNGCYCSSLWINKTRYPELLRGRGPLIKPRWLESGEWHRASCNPGTTGNTETKYVSEQHPKDTSKMPRGISEVARVSTETPALMNISLTL